MYGMWHVGVKPRVRLKLMQKELADVIRYSVQVVDVQSETDRWPA